MNVEKIKAEILKLREQFIGLGRVGKVWITTLALMTFALAFAWICLEELSANISGGTAGTAGIEGACDTVSVEEKIADVQDEAFGYLSELEKQIEAGETDYRLCYLTFDDGPYANTYEVLKILDENKVQATFFTTSVNGDYCYDDSSVQTKPIYREYTKYGHTIANHTYTHAIFNGLYSSKEAFMEAVDKQEKYICEQTGVKTNICRFPGGVNSAGGLREDIQQELREKGYGWVDWTCSTGDGSGQISADEALNTFRKTFGDSPIEVVLMHDYCYGTTEMLPTAISVAREQNYIFAPLFYESAAIEK